MSEEQPQTPFRRWFKLHKWDIETIYYFEDDIQRVWDAAVEYQREADAQIAEEWKAFTGFRGPTHDPSQYNEANRATSEWARAHYAAKEFIAAAIRKGSA